MIKACRITFLFIVVCKTFVHAQETDKNSYELLKMEVDLLRIYENFSELSLALIDSAEAFANDGAYDFAFVYLEQARSEISVRTDFQKNQNLMIDEETKFDFSLVTGLDYNRQEFELGFEQSDSVLLDELTKPFIGLNINFNATNNLKFGNIVRYDKENLQNEFSISQSLKLFNFSSLISGGVLYDKNFTYQDLTFTEFYTDLDFKNIDFDSEWSWSIKNQTRLKSFNEPSKTIPDFFRNTSYFYGTYTFNPQKYILMDYLIDLNESLKYQNNDFLQQDAGFTYQDNFFSKLLIKSIIRYRHNDFNYLISDNFADSSFSNTSVTISVNPNVKYSLSSRINFEIAYKIDFKEFNFKTEQEPDYIYQLLKPLINISLSDFTNLGIGYIQERKKHASIAELDNAYIKDQDYISNGLVLNIDHAALSGMLLSLNAEYSFRRFPNYKSAANFTLYANRNILNLLFFAQIPVNKNISFNLIGSYDNDKDIDSDFNDTISSFYTFELEYNF